MVKRIIEGKTYNTETATKLAEARFKNHTGDSYDQLHYDHLYQSRAGAYFACGGHPFSPDEVKITPLSTKEAAAWLKKYASESAPPEESTVTEGESRYTLRMPERLKQRIDAAAQARSQSTNAWIVRALEQALLTSS